MIKIRVVEQSRGVWRAEIDGEEQSAAISGAPDRALAALIRENLHRFGVAEILYASELDGGESGGDDSVPKPENGSAGDVERGKSVYPPRGGLGNSVEGG